MSDLRDAMNDPRFTQASDEVVKEVAEAARLLANIAVGSGRQLSALAISLSMVAIYNEDIGEEMAGVKAIDLMAKLARAHYEYHRTMGGQVAGNA